MLVSDAPTSNKLKSKGKTTRLQGPSPMSTGARRPGVAEVTGTGHLPTHAFHGKVHSDSFMACV